MAGKRRTDLLGRLADMSEEAIQRLSDTPGADKVLGAMNALRDRTDELQKRVRGVETLEQRLAALEPKRRQAREERRLDGLEHDAEEHEGHEHEELGRDGGEEELEA